MLTIQAGPQLLTELQADPRVQDIEGAVLAITSLPHGTQASLLLPALICSIEL